jgi:chemotaxis methyl-accepting protein methylase
MAPTPASTRFRTCLARSSSSRARSACRSAVQKDLRRRVIFGRHDLLDDAPISRVDLLLCRNTLMYFNQEVAQLRNDE